MNIKTKSFLISALGPLFLFIGIVAFQPILKKEFNVLRLTTMLSISSMILCANLFIRKGSKDAPFNFLILAFSIFDALMDWFILYLLLLISIRNSFFFLCSMVVYSISLACFFCVIFDIRFIIPVFVSIILFGLLNRLEFYETYFLSFTSNKFVRLFMKESYIISSFFVIPVIERVCFLILFYIPERYSTTNFYKSLILFLFSLLDVFLNFQLFKSELLIIHNNKFLYVVAVSSLSISFVLITSLPKFFDFRIFGKSVSILCILALILYFFENTTSNIFMKTILERETTNIYLLFLIIPVFCFYISNTPIRQNEAPVV